MKTILHEKAQAAKENPVAFLSINSVFGALNESAVFVEAYNTSYQNIITNGLEKCVIEMNNLNRS